MASWNGRTESVKSLLNHSDIYVNIKDNFGRTPLKMACIRNKYSSSSNRNRNTDVVNLLKAH